MRMLKRLFIASAVALGVLTASAAFLLATQSGLKVLLWGAERALPQLAQINAQGTVFNLQAGDVHWVQPGLDFTGQFGWRLNTSKLLAGEIAFDEIFFKDSALTVETDKLESSPAAEKDTAEGLQSQKIDLRAPIPIRIESFTVDRFTAKVNQQAFDLERFITTAAWDAQGVQVSNLDLKAKFNNQPVTLTGKIATTEAGQKLDIEDLTAQAGPNRMKTAGSVLFHDKVPELALELDVNAPDFSAVLDQLKGNAQGRIRLTGPALMPLLDADFQLNRFSMPDLALNRLTLKGALSTEASAAGALRLNVDGLRAATTHVDSISADITGSLAAHVAKLSAKAQGFDADTLIEAALNETDTVWSAVVKAINVKGPYGPVKLDEAFPLVVNLETQKIDVGAFCLSHPQWGVCSRKPLTYDAVNKEALSATIDVTRLDLAFLRYFSPQELYLEGTVTASSDILIPEGHTALPQLTFSASGQTLQSRYRMPDRDFTVNFDGIELNAEHDGKNVLADWRVKLTDNGQVTGRVTIADAQTKRGLDGALKIEALNARLFDSLLAQGETAKGTIYGDIRIAGTLAEPLLYGSTGVESLVVDSTKLPFEMLPSHFKLAFNGNTSTLTSTLNTRKGTMTLTGDADWKGIAEGTARVSAKGVNLRVTMPPAIEFDLTTDVQCQASAEKIVLDGAIDVPWARVKVYDLPASAVEVSDDTVRLDRPRSVRSQRSQSIPVDSNLFINIGDNVRVEAMGLRASINGQLHVVQVNNRMGLNGQINVPRGQFKAYGQDLIVRRGEFMFAGAADNPFIQLEAIRNPDKTADDVIAGIRVTGTADSPQVTVFSDPAKSDNEALSYLIRGEGLDPAGEDDNSMITSALINLGLSQGNRVLESLGDAVGISGLGVDTEGAGESSRVAVSGYILPGLKVKYAVGLFDSLATITLRYRIIPRLYIEATSGVDQTLDLLYSFEF